MSTTFIYTVTIRTLGPLLLRGTTSDSSFKLTALTVLQPVAPGQEPDRTIKKSSASDRINALSTSEFDALKTKPTPYSLAITGTEQSNGNFIISALVINSTSASAAVARALPTSGRIEAEDSTFTMNPPPLPGGGLGALEQIAAELRLMNGQLTQGLDLLRELRSESAPKSARGKTVRTLPSRARNDRALPPRRKTGT